MIANCSFINYQNDDGSFSKRPVLKTVYPPTDIFAIRFTSLDVHVYSSLRRRFLCIAVIEVVTEKRILGLILNGAMGLVLRVLRVERAVAQAI